MGRPEVIFLSLKNSLILSDSAKLSRIFLVCFQGDIIDLYSVVTNWEIVEKSSKHFILILSSYVIYGKCFAVTTQNTTESYIYSNAKSDYPIQNIMKFVYLSCSNEMFFVKLTVIAHFLCKVDWDLRIWLTRI